MWLQNFENRLAMTNLRRCIIIMGKDKNGSFGWLLSQPGEREGKFTASVILAALSMLCGIVPYYFIAKIVKMLLEGSTDKSAYIAYSAV